MTETFQYVPLAQLHESPSNPRKTFADLDDLVASVKEHGILEPLRARPMPNGKEPSFEIVFGARRYRAAKMAELEQAPVVVREMTDLEVLDAQIQENLQRSDLHPLEEAESYRRLREVHGFGIDELAAKVGKSKAYVYGRLKLCALAPKVREAFFKGTLPASHALLIARIPHADLQAKALEALTPEHWDTKAREALPYREAVDVMHSQFMLRLADAPFATADALLVSEAGACSTCPKRTGNQRELFSDVSAKDDLCTDPKCFAVKRDAAWKEKAAKLEAEGHTVPTEKEAKKLVSQYGSLQPEARERYRALDEWESSDPKRRTVGALLGKKHGLRLTVVRDQTGRVHELVDKREAQKVIRERHEWAKPQPKEKGKPAQASGANAALGTHAVKAKAAELAMVAVLDAQSKKWPLAAWQALVQVADHLSEDPELVLVRRGVLAKDKARGYQNDATRQALKALVKGMDEVALRGLVLELLCAGFDGYQSDALSTLAGGFAIDLKPFEAEAKRQLEEADKPKAKAEKAPAKKGGRR